MLENVTRWAALLALFLMVAPVVAGVVGVVLPAFGYFPALGGNEFTIRPFLDLAIQPGLLRSLSLSLFAGLASTLISLLVIMLFLAGAGRMRLWIEHAIGPLLAIPHAAAAIGLAYLIAPSGWLIRLISPWATGFERPPDVLIIHDPWALTLILGLVVKEVPFLLFVALAALPQLDERQQLMLARSMGYSPFVAWIKTVSPLLYERMRLPVFAVFAYGASTVDMAIILGPTNPPLLPILTLRLLNDPDLTMRFQAAAAACLQIAVALAGFALLYGIELLWRWRLQTACRAGARLRPAASMGRVGLSSMTAVTVVSILMMTGLLLWSFTRSWRFPMAWPQGLTTGHWTTVLNGLRSPLQTSILLALLAAGTATVLVLVILLQEERQTERAGSGLARSTGLFFRQKLLIPLLFLPLLIPQIGFVTGLVWAFDRLGLRPGFGPVLLGHLITVVPYVYLAAAGAFQRFDRRYIQTARSFGASPLRVLWRIRLPMLLAPLAAAFAIGFAVSIGQYVPTLLLGAGRVLTVTNEAVALASGGDRRIVAVWALIQASMPAIAFLLAVKVPRRIWRNRQGMRAMV